MTDLYFVDANVFVYWRDPIDGVKYSKANDWMEQLWIQGTGRTSTQALSEFYTTVTRKVARPLSKPDAWEYVESLIAWNPQPIDSGVLARARQIEERYSLSWWDSLIVAAAQVQHCVLLLTEDLQDGAVYGSVTVRDPFRLSVGEAVATYGAAPTPRYRSRPSAMRT
jgi:predicted nucleic acid-binding protein